MKEAKKALSLVLCSAMLVTGLSMANTSNYANAAAKTIVNEAHVAKTASGDAVDTPSPSATTATTDVHDPTGTPYTTPPTSTATTIPTAEPTTSPAITPTTSAITGTAVYAIGDKFNTTNYVFVVSKEASATETGEIKLKRIRNATVVKKTLTVPDTVTKGGNTFKVTVIGEGAFKASTKLKTVTIGKNVATIGVRAFQQVKTLQQVKLGNGLVTIKQQAFAGCIGLRSVTIPAKVKMIGIKSFYNCKKLKAVIIDSKKITTIKSGAFTNTKAGRYVVIPSGKKAAYKSLLSKAGASSMKIYTW